MKSVLPLFSVLATGLGAGWLIFGLQGRAGDVAIGFLLGVCVTLMLGMVIGSKVKGMQES